MPAGAGNVICVPVLFTVKPDVETTIDGTVPRRPTFVRVPAPPRRR
jgi:hypothetical protein